MRLQYQLEKDCDARLKPLPDGDRRIQLMLAIDGLGLGGAEMVLADLARGMDRNWIDVTVCCTKNIGGSIGNGLLRDGFDVVVLPDCETRPGVYTSSIKLRKVIKGRNIDVIHTHSTGAFLDATLCKLTLPRLKVVNTFHYGNYPHKAWRHHYLEGAMARVTDKLVSVGHAQRARIQECYGIPESRISVIWNGIQAPKAMTACTSFRREIGAGDRLIVGTVAKLIEQKGLMDLLEVARRCSDAGHSMLFVVVGGGPLRGALEARRRELGLERSVVFTGWLPEAASRAVPEFDVFLQTSHWEAMSIAILEAMANAKPIVATRVGDNSRVLTNGVTGLLVDAGDVGGIADAVGALAERSIRDRLGTGARQAFTDRFTVEHMIAAYEDVYRGLLATR